MRNPYFTQGIQSEQNLYEDLIIESLKIYGTDVYYIPRILVNVDSILGDDIPSTFSNAYEVEMYIETVDGFSGEGDLFQKFGIEIRDQATFVVSRRRWSETVAVNENDINTDLPEVGDLIYLPLSKSIFQIMMVERESPFYQLQNLNVVRLECELFEYNDEQLDTGIPEIDGIESLGYEAIITLDVDSDVTPIIVGDTVTQSLTDGTNITGEIIEWDQTNQRLSLAHVGSSDGDFHLFTTGGELTFTGSGTTRKIRGVGEDFGDHYHQNDIFDSGVDPFLDFSEVNPFGDPS